MPKCSLTMLLARYCRLAGLVVFFLSTLGYAEEREVMVKTISFIAFLSLAVAFNANAHDSDRINQLEKEIQEIKFRLSKLESFPSNPSNAQEPATSVDGWKSVLNWRKLAQGMSTSDVRRILGEPHTVDGGSLVHWQYQNGGRITFFDGRVERWNEPRK